MTAELLAAAAAGRVRIAIGRASDFFGPGVTGGSTLGERVFGNALADRRADFIGNPNLARPFFNPATGEWITYTAIAEDNGGQLVRFTWRSVPGGVITEHIHPHQEERFTILAGRSDRSDGRMGDKPGDSGKDHPRRTG
jgi:hypothetical protein